MSPMVIFGLGVASANFAAFFHSKKRIWLAWGSIQLVTVAVVYFTHSQLGQG